MKIVDISRLRSISPRAVVITGAAVLVVAAVALGLFFWSGVQERRAASTYAAAIARSEAARGAQATPEARAAAIREIEQALAQYPSGAMAGEAAYALGDLRYAERDFARARAAYQLALARRTGGTIRTLAQAGLGYAWEAERRYPQALEAFQSALGGLGRGDFYYEELAVDVARVQELSGKKAEAIESYRRLLKDLPNSNRADDIRGRLASLGAAP